MANYFGPPKLLNAQGSSLPNVGGALLGWMQPMTFVRVTKTVLGFQVRETGEPVTFRGVIQPLSDRQLFLKPEGQRAWSWYQLHAEPTLALDVDEVVIWQGGQTRVMSLKDYSEYGYIEYHLVQDWENAGPEIPEE